MKTYVLRNVPTIVDDLEDHCRKDTTVTLMFTPDPDAHYPLGIGIDEVQMLFTFPLDQLIEKIKNDLKEGKL